MEHPGADSTPRRATGHPRAARAAAGAPARRRRALGGALALALLAGACASPPRSSFEPEPGPAEAIHRGAPAWVGQPAGWAKLEEIEAWLRGREAARSPFWRVQGELDLAEGRLELAEADRAQGRDDAALAARVAAAAAGYQRALVDPSASEAQRQRARAGLARARGADAVAPAVGDVQLVSRAQWRATGTVPSRLEPVGRDWQRITVHHSAEVPGVRFDGSLVDSIDAVRKIQRHHITGRGWGDIGYHYLIDPAGRVFEGRSLRWQGAHAGGVNNVGNIGICVLGDFRTAPPSPQALAALQELLEDLRARNGIPLREVHGHDEYKNTVCPGAELGRWLAAYTHGRGAARTARARTAAAVAAAPRVVHASAGVVR